MRIECKSVEPGPLSQKGVWGIVDCRLTEADAPIRYLGDAYSVVNSSLRALGINASVVFTENENIGDRFMIYKFHIIEDNVSLASVRLVTKEHSPIRLIITIDKLAISLMGEQG